MATDSLLTNVPFWIAIGFAILIGICVCSCTVFGRNPGGLFWDCFTWTADTTGQLWRCCGWCCGAGADVEEDEAMMAEMGEGVAPKPAAEQGGPLPTLPLRCDRGRKGDRDCWEQDPVLRDARRAPVII